MRIEFKSLVILSRTTSGYSTKTITTVYDLASVRDHSLEIPRARLLFHPGIFWRVAVFAVLPITLLLIWTEGAPQDHPGLVSGVLVPWCMLFYAVAYGAVKVQEMEQFARRERGLGADTMLGVVENGYWDSFVAKLRCDPRAVGLAGLQRRPKLMDVQELAARLRLLMEARARERGSDGSAP